MIILSSNVFRSRKPIRISIYIPNKTNYFI